MVRAPKVRASPTEVKLRKVMPAPIMINDDVFSNKLHTGCLPTVGNLKNQN